MKNSVIIVAGGSGSRMKTEIPKQFLLLSGIPVLMHTIKRFYIFSSEIEIILVLPEQHINMWEKLVNTHNFKIKHTVVKGGKERFNSVKNGLSAIKNTGLIAIHDGVRPLVSNKTLFSAFKTAEKYGTAVPVINLVNSVRKVYPNGENKSVNRDEYRLVQTPQVFNSDLIKKAYNTKFSTAFTDDASVAQDAGNKIHLCEGNRENIKITNPEDLKIAEFMIQSV